MNEDYSLSLPLFKGYVEYIKPPSCKEIPDSLGKFKGISGTLWGIPYFSVPHSNVRVKGQLRDEIWKGVGMDVNKVAVGE